MNPSSYVTFEKWATDLTRSLPQLIIPLPMKEVGNWWQWANNFVSVNRLYNLPLSNKGKFPVEESWRDWANLCIQDLQSINFTN
jgi:hypothetical protein